MIFSEKCIQFLNQSLKLDASGSEQDWDLGLANPDRLDEFIEYYESNLDLKSEIKRPLIALIVASLDEKINSTNHRKYFLKIFDIMNKNKKIFEEIYDKWGFDPTYPKEDQFEISPLLFDIKKILNISEEKDMGNH